MSELQESESRIDGDTGVQRGGKNSGRGKGRGPPKNPVGVTEMDDSVKNLLTSITQSMTEQSSAIKSLATIPEMIQAQMKAMQQLTNSMDIGEGDYESYSEGDDNTESDPEDGLIDILELNQAENEFGLPVLEVVARAFAKIPSQIMNDTATERLKSAYKAPSNCTELVVPKVNQEIWSVLPPTAKSIDIKSQFVQEQVFRSLVAHAKIAELTMSMATKPSTETSEQILKILMDSASSLGIATREMNSRRKFQLNPFLNGDISGLCSTRNISSEGLLFGSNLEQEMITIRNFSKVVRPITSTVSRFCPYNSFQSKRTGYNNLNFQRPLLWGRGSGRRYHRRPSFFRSNRFQSQSQSNQ